MINFRKATFVTSATGDKDILLDHDHVLLVGKSNVGKSSLLNSLSDNKTLAYVSKTPGHTKLLNHFLIDDSLYLVDAPGYGYRKLGKKDQFDIMMDHYFIGNYRLKLVVWLLDPRHEPSEEDHNFYEYLNKCDLKTLIVFTKSDKLNQKEHYQATKNVANNFPGLEYLFTSSLNKRGIKELRTKINSYL